MNPLYIRILGADYSSKERSKRCDKFTMTTTKIKDDGQILIRKSHPALWLR